MVCLLVVVLCGPVVLTAIWHFLLRSGSQKRGEGALIKSNNPHLAGGNKNGTPSGKNLHMNSMGSSGFILNDPESATRAIPVRSVIYLTSCLM